VVNPERHGQIISTKPPVGHARHSVNCINCTVWKYLHLLTYLLTIVQYRATNEHNFLLYSSTACSDKKC